MIVSFGNPGTEDLYHGRRTRRARRFPADIVASALRKLELINAAHVLSDLKAPPANKLEALKGTLAGYHSIRVNDQWRIVFRWSEGNAHEVELTDYHD